MRREHSQFTRQCEIDLLFADRMLLDRGIELPLQQLDALLDDRFRSAGAGGNQDGIVGLKPGKFDIRRPVDQKRAGSRLARNSANRWLLELF